MDIINKFYVTTPIYYVTAKPHVGSLYSTLLADVISRWNKLKGYNIFFLTGTDEHGQKIAQAAQKAGKNPKEFVDSFIDAYKKMWHDYHLDYTYFIRTTDKDHVQAVQFWLQKLIDKGDVYLAHYQGWYCTHCESFAAELNESQEMLPCPLCNRETSLVSEESYFFKLSAYQEKLLAFYEAHQDFIVPRERAQEVINFVKAGLRDLSISRTTITWGIPFPGSDKHVTYVWADALNNYITAIGYGQEDKKEQFNYWWPADLHILGKDIIRFHAIYWPAFLMASGLELPKKLLVHGWIKVDNEKMSKSRHNVVDPEYLAQTYGIDPVRYYLIRQFSTGQDSNFAYEDLEQRNNADLANDLGNLLNRMTALTEKNNIFALEPCAQWSQASKDLQEQCKQMVAEVKNYMNDYSLHMALASVWKFIAQTNAYFHAHEPWKLVQKDKQLFLEVMSATCHSLKTIGIILWPVMPTTMQQLLMSIGHSVEINGENTSAYLNNNQWNNSFMIQKIPTLFTKIEPKQDMVSEKIEAKEIVDTTVDITDFTKIELRVGTIQLCQPIEKSDKLYKLQVNFGDQGVRQILSGIKQFFSIDELEGKQAVFVFNLKPRKMMGLESQGMILTAKDAEGKINLIQPQASVPNGTMLS